MSLVQQTKINSKVARNTFLTAYTLQTDFCQIFAVSAGEIKVKPWFDIAKWDEMKCPSPVQSDVYCL